MLYNYEKKFGVIVNSLRDICVEYYLYLISFCPMEES